MTVNASYSYNANSPKRPQGQKEIKEQEAIQDPFVTTKGEAPTVTQPDFLSEMQMSLGSNPLSSFFQRSLQDSGLESTKPALPEFKLSTADLFASSQVVKPTVQFAEPEVIQKEVSDVPTFVEVSPKRESNVVDAPTFVEVSPKGESNVVDAPTFVEVSPKGESNVVDAPTFVEVSPKRESKVVDAPTFVEVSPKRESNVVDAPTFVEVSPKRESNVVDAPTFVEVSPKGESNVVDAPTFVEVSPKGESNVVDAPTFVEVSPKGESNVVDAPTFVEVSPKGESNVVDAPTFVEVSPKGESNVVDAPTFVEVSPKRESKVVDAPTTAEALPKEGASATVTNSYFTAPSDEAPVIDGQSGAPNTAKVVPNDKPYTAEEEKALKNKLVNDYGLDPELAATLDLNGYKWDTGDPATSHTVARYEIDEDTKNLVEGLNKGWKAMPESFRKAYQDSNTKLVLSNEDLIQGNTLGSRISGDNLSIMTIASNSGNTNDIAHTFAHESAHIVDGQLNISGSPEFQAAYKKDLQDALYKGIPLTEEYGMDALSNFDWSTYMGSEAFADIMASNAVKDGGSEYHNGVIQNKAGQTENLFNNTEEYLKKQGYLGNDYQVQQDSQDFKYGESILMSDVYADGKKAGLGDDDLKFIGQWSQENPGKSLHFGKSLFDNFATIAGSDRLISKEELEANKHLLDPEEAAYLTDYFDVADTMEGSIANGTNGKLSSNGSAKPDGLLSYEDIFYLITANKFFAY